MSAKRSAKEVRKCRFCSKHLDGLRPNAQYCSASCRSKAFRARHLLSHSEAAIYRTLSVVEQALYAPEFKAKAIDVLQSLHDVIEGVLKRGYQATLPGVEDE